MKASSFLEWKSPGGRKNSIILVYDESDSVAWFEHVSFNEDSGEWVTHVEIEGVDEIEAVSYPEDIIEEINAPDS